MRDRIILLSYFPFFYQVQESLQTQSERKPAELFGHIPMGLPRQISPGHSAHVLECSWSSGRAPGLPCPNWQGGTNAGVRMVPWIWERLCCTLGGGWGSELGLAALGGMAVTENLWSWALVHYWVLSPCLCLLPTCGTEPKPGFLQQFPAMSAPVKTCPLVAELSGAYFTLPVLHVMSRVHDTMRNLLVVFLKSQREVLDTQGKGSSSSLHPVSPLVHCRQIMQFFLLILVS